MTGAVIDERCHGMRKVVALQAVGDPSSVDAGRPEKIIAARHEHNWTIYALHGNLCRRMLLEQQVLERLDREHLALFGRVAVAVRAGHERHIPAAVRPGAAYLLTDHPG